MIYTIVWIIVAVLHGTMLWYFMKFPVSIVITEALTSSLLFGLLGLLAWYPTRYIPFQRQFPFYSVIAHVAAGILVLLTWLLLTVGLLGEVFRGNEEYSDFLTGSIVWRSLSGGIIYLLLVLIYYMASYSQKLQERAQQEERLKNLVRESELSMLKSQINPHFLFNSLNSISSLTMSNPDEARDMIIRLSDFLRYSLKHRENEFVPLKEEVGRMRDYLAIEKIRFGDKLKFEFEIEAECEEVPVPTMIFQPLFENAIKHGVYESVTPVALRFDCKTDNGYMKCVLSNDYDPGIPSRKGTGVGLQNVRQRIELVYDNKGSIHWKREQGKFNVIILFPRIFVQR